MSINPPGTPFSTRYLEKIITRTKSQQDPKQDKSQPDSRQDLWIKLYYHLLWAIANLPVAPLVFQNSVEIHERFIREFPLPIDRSHSSSDNEVLVAQSLRDFTSRCDKLAGDIKWKLQQLMKSRIQKGSRTIVTGIEITRELMNRYRNIREPTALINSTYCVEDDPRMWKFLSDTAASTLPPTLTVCLKINPNRMLQVRCMAMAALDGFMRCERRFTKTAFEIVQDVPWRTCDVHRGQAAPTGTGRSVIATVAAGGDIQQSYHTDDEEREEGGRRNKKFDS